ncbi:uncharacterized protein LOC141611413 [Silene latifolia]|uniref:uncharacterized protein LOC141611413 n=1 Tax=Silene latifolia TaxID=37657 RepID=UPI003D76B1FA
MTMGSLQMMKPAVFSAFHGSRVVELDSEVQGKGFLRLRSRHRGFGVNDGGRRRRACYGNKVCCKLQDGENRPSDSNGEPPESLFMKELRKRGISPASLLEEINNGTFGNEIMEEGGDRSFSQRNSIAMGRLDKSLTNQREQSMALNSEGLEGLIPRGKVLLRLGGTFFLAFWPLILITFGVFAALYLYFGPTFVHDGSNIPIAPPQYIDPYVLLQEERITQ